jgi:mannitol-specific phosphotransferase system IIBC component
MLNKSQIIITSIIVAVIVVICVFFNNQAKDYKEQSFKYKAQFEQADSTNKKMSDSIESIGRKYSEVLNRNTTTEVESVVVIRWRDNGTMESSETVLRRKIHDTLYISKTDTMWKNVEVIKAETTTVTETKTVIDSSGKTIHSVTIPNDNLFKVGVGANTDYKFNVEPNVSAFYYRKVSKFYAGGGVTYPFSDPTNTKLSVDVGLMF